VTIEIRIDEGACMGSRECSFWAPGVFDNREDGTAFVVDADGEPVSKVVQAAKGCPNFAIQVFEDGEQIA